MITLDKVIQTLESETEVIPGRKYFLYKDEKGNRCGCILGLVLYRNFNFQLEFDSYEEYYKFSLPNCKREATCIIPYHEDEVWSQFVKDNFEPQVIRLFTSFFSISDHMTNKTFKDYAEILKNAKDNN